MDDLDLESDPPRITVRPRSTKGGVGTRTVFFAYDAREAIKAWLRTKPKTDNLIWDIYYPRISEVWLPALNKVGLGQKDPVTGIRILHIHTLRKRFRTRMGLDTDLTHALMGHRGYLDAAYVRLGIDELARQYKSAMQRVAVYNPLKAESKTEQLLKQLKELGISKDELLKALESEFHFQRVEAPTERAVNKVKGFDLIELAGVLFPEILESVVHRLTTPEG